MFLKDTPQDVESWHAALRQSLLPWFKSAQRALPWRKTRDPYAIWVSEVMLQQTRVETVIPYFERFLRHWPSTRELAAAPPEEVRAAWSGLGYYRRVENMRHAAAIVVREHSGHLPTKADALRKLPGFGAYTAGAVASIAFGEAIAAVDGNVTRVLARVLALKANLERTVPKQQIQQLAQSLAQCAQPGDVNQALMELGATICTPKNPRCGDCPIQKDCMAHAQKLEHLIPTPKKRKKPMQMLVNLLILTTPKHEIVLEQRPRAGLFAQLWCPLWISGQQTAQEMAEAVSGHYHLRVQRLQKLRGFRHVLTHRQLEVVVFRGTVRTHEHARLRNFQPEELPKLALPSLAVRALKEGLPAKLRQGIKWPGRRTAPTNGGSKHGP